MDLHNEFNLPPGVYEDDKGEKVVATDVITHCWESESGLVALLPHYLVVVRPLVDSKPYRRYLYPMEVFKAKFKQI